jgi:hypothetical protein
MKKGELCGEKEMETCSQEHDEAELAWACLHCTKLKAEEIHPYTRKLLDIRTLQAAGFPLDADMLTYEEWLDLGKINQWLETPKLM